MSNGPTPSPAEFDPPGTFRDTGNVTSLDESRAEAHVNRYFIKWSPPCDRDEAHPWVAINHEAGLQRMPNDLMDRYPIVPAEVVQQRLAQHWTGRSAMPNPTSTKPDTITVSRRVAWVVMLLLAASLIDGLRDLTGWHFLVIFSATARTMALIETVIQLATRKAKRGGD